MYQDLSPKFNKTINPKIFINQEFILQFLCPLCEGVLNEPSMELCGCMKLFCKRCLNQYLKFNNNKFPISGEKAVKEPKLMEWVQNSLNLLDVKCKNLSESCNWTVKYIEYAEHLKLCIKEPTHCIYKGCNKIFLTEKLEEHLKECVYRTYICTKYGLKLIYLDKDIHNEVCPKKEIKCPQKCGAIIQKCKMNEHIKSCPFSPISCPFGTIGYQEKIIRNNLEGKKNQNINNNHYLTLLLNEYLNFKKKIIDFLSLSHEDFDFSSTNNTNKVINQECLQYNQTQIPNIITPEQDCNNKNMTNNRNNINIQ